jgi:hypothetical protein
MGRRDRGGKVASPASSQHSVRGAAQTVELPQDGVQPVISPQARRHTVG